MMMLTLRLLRLPHASKPAARWWYAVYPGCALLLAAACLHGVLRGEWLQELAPQITQVIRSRPAEAKVTYQAFLAVGIVLVCEASRAMADAPAARLQDKTKTGNN